jgi:hypothetical protein
VSRPAEFLFRLEARLLSNNLQLFQGERTVAVFSVACMADSCSEGANKSALYRKVANWKAVANY